ncbi:HAD-IA family hydrolase [Aquicoccus porphyridii]|uniref:phosphoglycolate phosphatase n=1 Tax=Aquicoccus porphyridii TaxID=1852029 RepID=A0A5A9Z6R3_9RHOB|nr:HAD-IA family hydrolase [Aquicoccus porphyridii]KAA0912645.1 HAD-IA family hydrolase [Aquicoccus porphyridii]RAI55456.1 hypothetical protein DOO74_03305 [Rhodobacteraceae bacterium AsT-22]
MSDPIRHISFDLDGTLINSFAIMQEAWEAATEKLRINCGFAEYRRYVGLPFPRILELLGLSNFEMELNELYFAHTRRLYDRIDQIDGASGLLDWCREQGFGTSIITSKPRANSELIIERIGFSVDALVCGDDLTRGKPDPMAARIVCEQTGATPAEMLYVGDMIFDFQFALNAGMRFVMLAPDGGAPLPRNLLNHVDRIGTLAAVRDHVG